MKFPTTFALLSLLSLFALSHVIKANSQSGESAEQSKRRHSCGGLVEEPPSSSEESTPPSPSPKPTTVPAPPPGQCVCTPAPTTDDGSNEGSGEGNFHSKCILVEAFFNMSITLTIEEQVIWEEWIKEIQNTILIDISLTEDEKVVLISLSLKAFFSVNIEIYKKLSYKKIAEWGFVEDFLYVSISIQIEITQKIVTLDDSNSCDLTEALLNATANSSDQEQDACNSLVVEIQAILEDSSYSYEQQLSIVFELFESFFVQHPSMKSFLLSIKIKGYGSVKSFLEVCRVYKRITTLSLAIGGSEETDCAILAGLEEASKNGSFTPEQQQQVLQLKVKLKAFFKTTTSLKLRLKYISAQCYQLFKLGPWMISLIERISCGEWGSIYDIIFCSGVCTNNGCGEPDNGSGPQGSTAMPSTPGVVPHDCSKVGSLIVIDSNNKTHLTNTLQTAYDSWTYSQQVGFNSCFNQVRQAVWNHTAYPTQASKLAKCNSAFKGYNTNNPAKQQVLFSLIITVWQGTIGHFVNCTS